MTWPGTGWAPTGLWLITTLKRLTWSDHFPETSMPTAGHLSGSQHWGKPEKCSTTDCHWLKGFWHCLLTYVPGQTLWKLILKSQYSFTPSDSDMVSFQLIQISCQRDCSLCVSQTNNIALQLLWYQSWVSTEELTYAWVKKPWNSDSCEEELPHEAASTHCLWKCHLRLPKCNPKGIFLRRYHKLTTKCLCHPKECTIAVGATDATYVLSMVQNVIIASARATLNVYVTSSTSHLKRSQTSMVHFWLLQVLLPTARISVLTNFSMLAGLSMAWKCCFYRKPIQ